MVYALRDLGAREHSPAIAELLKSKYAGQRAAAAQALGQLRAKEFATDIADLLKDDLGTVMARAATTLAQFGAKEYAKDIARLLQHTEAVDQHREKAKLGAGEGRGDGYTGKSSVMARTHAAAAVLELGAKEYWKDVTELLKDPDPEVRGDVVSLLGKHGVKESAQEIASLVNDSGRCHDGQWTTVGALARRVLKHWGIDPKKAPLKIEKIYFMIHPCCWTPYGPKAPAGADQKNWTACFNREVEVNRLQKEFISRMNSNEVLVVLPMGSAELEQHAARALGRRCIVLRRSATASPEAWRKLPNWTDRFLNDPKLAGKAEFLKDVPAGIQGELEAEIRKAWEPRRPSWNTAVLKVIYYSRLLALDLENEFKRRKLFYDKATVRSEAFGEGFEQCAMTWKTMLVPYLGLAHPAENIWDLSVSGGPFSVNAKFRERIDLDHQIRLYLLEGENGRKLAVYTRAWCRLKDPQFYAHVPFVGMNFEVRQVGNKQFWPKPDAPVFQLKEEAGCLKLPVYNGIRRDFNFRAPGVADEDAAWVIAEGISWQAFRERMVKVKISE